MLESIENRYSVIEIRLDVTEKKMRISFPFSRRGNKAAVVLCCYSVCFSLHEQRTSNKHFKTTCVK